ncbi:leech-derived tryptase inhibitor C-like [Anticarsia gemmatalis]|uniref:leech-derived tryptase inhibitor C-like n=1 Tax=Anticarsia gemmatalis TaxID=129554 RepID=UPI003F7611A5
MKLFTLLFTLFLVVIGAAFSSSARAGCFCTADYTPVCGKNGKTYSNSCRMSCDGVKLAHKGKC